MSRDRVLCKFVSFQCESRLSRHVECWESGRESAISVRERTVPTPCYSVVTLVELYREVVDIAWDRNREDWMIP
mgnify:CR=1 FL=1